MIISLHYFRDVSVAKYRFFSELIIQKRQELGFRTSKKFHASLDSPPVEYQSWIHIESGRRLPKPPTAIAIADCLEVTHEEAILAYTRDIFSEEYTQDGLKFLQDYARSIDNKRMLSEAKTIKKHWHSLTDEQYNEIESNPQLHDILITPFPNERMHIRDLSELCGLPVAHVLSLVSTLVDLGLLKYQNECVSKVYKGVILPRNPQTFSFRKQLLLHTLDREMNDRSLYKSYKVNLSRKDRDQIVKAFDLIDAKCLVGHEESRSAEQLDSYHVLIYLDGGES